MDEQKDGGQKKSGVSVSKLEELFPERVTKEDYDQIHAELKRLDAEQKRVPPWWLGFGSGTMQTLAVKQVAKADPQNIQEVAASQLAIINSYYQSGLEQSQQSFRWSLIWGGIGFGFLIGAVTVLLFGKPTEVALASGIAGALVEVLAGTYLYLYKHASDQLAAFRASLESTQQLLLANSMCERLEGELEQATRAELIRQMANAALGNWEFSNLSKERKS